MITIKYEHELSIMRKAGQIVADILNRVSDMIKPGVTTAQIDSFMESILHKTGAKAAFKGYNGFPAAVCTSVNEEVVHGIPGPRRLNEGDIVGIDFGVVWQGFYSDAAITVPVGEISPEVRRLLKVTQECLQLAIEKAYPGERLGVVSNTVQKHAESQGFSVVRDYVGHGIGRAMHEEPPVPNYGRPDRGPTLKEGMTIAIEPMINMGGWEVMVQPDNWTVVTRDKGFSAHFEHTIAITSRGPEILTRL
ncbi:MAG: type I methionyl aminopeptidase [Chitinophagales bacterium]